ncbi:MAG: EAL domain-containing protein [Cyanothece sp. SIO2G6]|nr:EAL domain-containing protein [Cyanothece sp. SIO2G6]
MSDIVPTRMPFSVNSFVVGIGASAGGLQALDAFFEAVPIDPDATFVVVQHLSPDFRSLMVELLQRRTQLPVSVIEDGTMLMLNHVYVLPPGMMVQLDNSTLRLVPYQDNTRNYTIDHFFSSLAQERSDRAIGILLSGTGSDGTEGLKAISRAGGIALVQSPETAQFGAMPTNPVSSGLVDEILSPEDLARAVCDIVRFTTSQETVKPDTEPILPADQLAQILDLLQEQENIDFTQYKTTTLHRRIVHRLLLSRMHSLDQYIAHLAQTPEELFNLRQDLLIGTTRFFRDPGMWSTLQSEVLPAIITKIPEGHPLRLWVAACSSGEEAYSLAIAAHEVLQQMDRTHPVKIFATDIDQEALNVASQGIYPASIVNDIGEKRVSLYFVREEAGYSIKRFLRSQIVFASHDLVKNPGFSQMHLISCRNLLIYMQSTLQEQVLKLLHFSLASRGVLLLGSSEHLGNLTHAFDVISPKWQIFRKRQEVHLAINRPMQAPILQAVPLSPAAKPIKSPYEKYLASVLRLRFGDRLSTCLLIDHDYQLCHIFLNTARLLDFPLGEMNNNVLDLVVPALRLPLSMALHRAKRDHQPILYSNIAAPDLPDNQQVNLWVGPAEAPGTAEALLIVLLEVVLLATTVTEDSVGAEFDPNLDLSQQFREMEFELKQTRQNLQTTIQELEAANEEQQATNEELLASNEELQSTNEELQSVNEELYTVNAENQERIKQLTELTTDIDNLLQSTDIGVVFLDRDFNIRKFTEAAVQVFNFRAGDVGRPLAELTNYLNIDNLTALIRQVADGEGVQERETTNLRTGDRLLLRILPYRQEDGSYDGFVLTLVDIRELKQTQDELLRSNTVLELLYRNSPFGLCFLDSNLRFTHLNQAFTEMSDLSIEQHLGQSVESVLPNLYQAIKVPCQRALSTQKPVKDIEIVGLTSAQPGVERTWIASYFPIELEGHQQGIGAIISEVTENKRILAELQDSQDLVQQIAETSPAILMLFELPSGKVTYINSAVETLLGYRLEEIYQDEDSFISLHIHPDDVEQVNNHFATLVQAKQGDVLSHEYRARHKDGSWHWIYQRSQVFKRNEDGTVQQILGVGTDISERVAMQAELERNERLLQSTLDGTPTVLFTQDENLLYTWVHNPIPGFKMEDMLGRHDRDLLNTVEAEALTTAKQRVLDTAEPCVFDFVLETGDTIRHFDLTIAPLYNVASNIVGITGVGIDVTPIRQSEINLRQITERLTQAQQIVGMGDWQYDLSTGQLTWSDQVFRIMGMSSESRVPPFAELLRMVHPEDRPLLLSLLGQAQVAQNSAATVSDLSESGAGSELSQANAQGPASDVAQDNLGEFDIDIRVYVDRGATLKYINIISRTQMSASGEAIGLYGTVIDITGRKQVETELQQQAFFDRLTKLPNRAFFLEHLKFATSKVKRDRVYQFAVLYLDLDGFKEVNDTLGHAAGDQLLIEVAQRLDETVRPGDIVSRLGGDEFAILLSKVERPEEAMQVAFRIQQAIATPINLTTTQLLPTVSIGIAFFDAADQWDSDTAVLENADIAMYQAKWQGPGNVALFQSSMRVEQTSKIILKAEIKQALEQDGFVLHYQPLIDFAQRYSSRGEGVPSLVGFEALVRWRHPQRGLLSPLEFLPTVQSAHLMPKLETWIFRQACHQLNQWKQQFSLVDNFRLNINISPDFIKHSHFINNLSLALNEFEVNPAQLCLELTENSFIGYGNFVETILQNLKQLGMQIVLDDFGTGYSSLSYLHRLPIDAIKIDQSFIQSLGVDDSLMGVTRGIVGLANQLNLGITAEGIETSQQLELVQDIGCHYGQGYFFSHPLPAQAATQLLHNPQSFARVLSD